MFTALVLVVVYLIVVSAPMILIAVIQMPADYSFTFEIGRSAALVAFGIILVQPVLVARLKTLERPFGLEIVSRFHKSMGVFAVVLLLFHPTLMAYGGFGWSIVTSLKLEWYYWLGRIALLLMIVHTLLGVFWNPLSLTFERWRCLHYTAAAILFALVFAHTWWGGYDLGPMAIQVLWVAMVTMAFAALVYHKVLVAMALQRHLHTVAAVAPERHNVWTVKLVPPEGEPIYEYLPGQFHFITFYRGSDLPVEEHHWTISSSPTAKGFISSSIKESGDFTRTIGQTRPGDKARVQGPFGRFSYFFHPEDRDMVFIAGGIGITPLMAMLRHMRDTSADVDVLLLFANRTQKDIVFREELEAMQGRERPRLQVVHILSHPEPGWDGETGHVDREKIRRFAKGNLAGKAFYICSPPAMTEKVMEALRGEGVPYEQMRTEQFSL